jgi:hypothetical protein
MADTANSTGTESTEEGQAPQGAAAAPAQEPGQRTLAESEIDWKAEARKWETRSKENAAVAKKNAAAAKQLQEIEDSKKSEVQKLTEQLESTQQQLQVRESESQRLKALGDHGIPTKYAPLVHGSNADELDASAQLVAQLLTSSTKPPVGLRISAEDKQPVVPASAGDWLRNQFHRK